MSAVSYIERLIIKRLVSDLLAADFAISINNGGVDNEIDWSTDEAAILAVMRAADEDRVYVNKPPHLSQYGWVYLVYGNDGFDVISDYTVNLEPIMAPIFKWIDEMEAE